MTTSCGSSAAARRRPGTTPGMPSRPLPPCKRLFCISGGEFYEVGEGGAATKLGDVATGVLPVTWAK